MLMMLMLADLVPLYKKQAQLMLMFACLRHLPSESPPDADEFGAEAARLRCSLVWGTCPSESPADADDARLLGAPAKRKSSWRCACAKSSLADADDVRLSGAFAKREST